MAAVRLSHRARADLRDIGDYTLKTWGAAQAARYLDDLQRCAKMLAGNPSLGKPCDMIRPGLHRFEKGRHTLFYLRDGSGILVARILHQGMLPSSQPFDDWGPEFPRSSSEAN